MVQTKKITKNYFRVTILLLAEIAAFVFLLYYIIIFVNIRQRGGALIVCTTTLIA